MVAVFPAALSPADAGAQGLFERITVKAGPSWTAASVVYPRADRERYADRVRSVFLALETRDLVGPVSGVVELGYVERSGPVLYSPYLVTPDAGSTAAPDGAGRYGFGSVAPLARVRLVHRPVRVYALAGPRAAFDLGGNLAGARDAMIELTGGVGVELPGVPVFLEVRGSLGLTDLALGDDEVHTRALDLLLGVAAQDRDGAGGGFVRRVSVKSGLTWGTTAARPLELSADGLLFWPFWSGFLAVETRDLVGPVGGVVELGFVQRGYARDQEPVQAHKHAALSAALLARAGVLRSRLGTVYALAGPRVAYRESEWTDDVRPELTAGVGFVFQHVPVFLEVRANASLTDAAPDPGPRWPWPDYHSYYRALDLFVGFNLIGR